MSDIETHSAGTNGPTFHVPPRSCDCHMHIFSSDCPAAKDAVLIHAEASLAAYQKLQGRLGIQRHIIVQPSTYGLDNSLMLRSMSQVGASCRGIAVISADIANDALGSMAAAGVVGVRFNLVQKGSTQLDMLEQTAMRIRPFGMHIQLHMHPLDLLATEEVLHRLPVPIVLDHFGRLGTQKDIENQTRQSIFRLLANGNCWIKLSGAYMVSRDGPPYFSDLQDFVQQLIHKAPDRVVWGSDWPHATETEKPNDGDLLSALGYWVSDAKSRQRILVDNPTRLYGFGAED